MQAYQLVELSALVAVNSADFVRSPDRLSDARIGQYWSASRMRFDRWAKRLRRFALETSGAPTPSPSRASGVWRSIESTLEEIFTGEILTRTWAAAACGHDQRHGYTFVSPIVRSVVLGHMESRNRALNAMFRAQKNDAKAVSAMNRLRHRSERWTDMLLAYMLPDCQIEPFAFDKSRCSDFADDLQDEFQGPQVEQAWRLMTFSLRASFGAAVGRRSPNTDLNGKIGSSVAACFRPDAFDSTDLFSSLWMERLNHLAEDAQAMIDELLAT